VSEPSEMNQNLVD